MATTGAYLGLIPTLAHPELVGVNPEVAHEQMAGLNFLHAVAQAWEAGKLFHIDLNDQAPGRYDQDFRFGAANPKSAFFLVKFLEDVGYEGPAPLRRARLSHRRTTTASRISRGLHAHLPDPEGSRPALERDKEIQALRARSRAGRRRRAPLSDGYLGGKDALLAADFDRDGDRGARAQVRAARPADDGVLLGAR
jgi:xylose isomerase